MIFISGIHGVGKSFFCEKIRNELGIATYSASQLISQRKHVSFASDKLISDINDNQQYLLMAVHELNKTSSEYLLDGHFCLLNNVGQVARVPLETFLALKPKAIVLLTENPNIIAERRKQRDQIDHDSDAIEEFQNEEITYATEVAEALGVSLKVSAGADNLSNTFDFIRTATGRESDGR